MTNKSKLFFFFYAHHSFMESLLLFTCFPSFFLSFFLSLILAGRLASSKREPLLLRLTSMCYPLSWPVSPSLPGLSARLWTVCRLTSVTHALPPLTMSTSSSVLLHLFHDSCKWSSRSLSVRCRSSSPSVLVPEFSLMSTYVIVYLSLTQMVS